ncbi:ABC transporter ATP-binding protein [Rhodoferax sp.]|uniref:ABC transporter ATP-binding protein n=1 Tax=Rhodoferax sp. TaxID=50421 RepID=UPI0025D57438|nr:ABC transporter ATP-binding protein [Rhodoferax sp.]
MSSDFSIQVVGLSKCYQIYDKPRDRLAQMFTFGRKQLYREFWALRDTSFSIGRGETVGIIGRNGSGKSTLLQMICGTVSPTTGTVTTNGRVAALLELGAGFNAEFTGRENVLLNAAILGFPQETMEERMDEVLAFSELGDFLDQPVKTYSSGMYARLAFSIAIHVDPDIMIVDEALAVGDSRFVAKCMRRIKEIQERGASILFVSHDVGSVRTLCQRAIWLDKGRLVEDGDVFPVSGKYMEFMFKDEVSEDQALREEIVSGQDTPNEAGALQTTELPKLTGTTFSPSKYRLDTRPVTHWGSRKGVILGASVCDEQGIRRDVITWGRSIEVVIDVCVPLDIPREHLSIACSIKDIKGTDLIVSTTSDQDSIGLPNQEHFSVCFRMVNPLVTGKYLLVAAVENRLHRDIHYYEYLEGAHYFSSLADERFFGIFQPTVEQLVKVA